eukprot:TRINITY_DN26570_c0_g1_i1.p1 TRINITY_DN26570_c0_g1~~TRINITY_DN26570_c0_g1_i1.p1  ORF type:complete len:186 (+),score=54.83 TRINITY_DN26570_c0_g1_i1:46-603(+)
MGNCSSDEGGRPASPHAAPQRAGSGHLPKRARVATGFGAPIARDNDFGGTATGEPDMEYYGSLPPLAVAEEVKRLHPNFGGKPGGINVLTNLYVSIRSLRELGKELGQVRFIQLDALEREPDAIRIANYAGFTTDVADVNRLSAEVNGHYVHKRTSQELDTVLQYVAAMLGGEPLMPPHLQINLS